MPKKKKVDKTIDKIRNHKVCISTRNGQRWISLKNHLRFLTDDELADYLLGLADSMIDQDKGSCEDQSCKVQESDAQSNFICNADSQIFNGNLQRRSSRKFKVDSKNTCSEKSKTLSNSSTKIEKHGQQEYKTCLKSSLGMTRQNKNQTRCHRDKRKQKNHKKIKDAKVAVDSGNEIMHRRMHDSEDVEQCLISENQSSNKSADMAEFHKNLKNDDQMVNTSINKSLEFDQSLANNAKVAENFTGKRETLGCQQSGAVLLLKDSDQDLDSRDHSSCEITSSLDDDGELAPNDDIRHSSTQSDKISTQLVDVKAAQSEVNPELPSPAIKPEHIMEDSTSLSTWRDKHKNNSELARVTNSENPMSRGYSDDVKFFSGSLEQQYKCDSEQSEEKQENIHWPLFSRESLPLCLELKMTNMDHGLGVFAKNLVPMHTQFGPLVGQYVQEMDIPDDYSMKHIWEISANNKTQYLSTTNPLKSNWIRYMRPAETEESRTVQLLERNGQVFFITCKTLMRGDELIYWLDSQSNSWTRKSRADKTNCGGCNLKFSHPIYYRLHCCIFHDTRYSLTIRKYHCKVCGSAVLGKDNIMKHAAQFHAGRGAYQCQYCKKFFLRLNYLEMHRTYGCSKNPSRSRPLCDFCGRKFCQPQKLKVHIKRMHSDTSEVLEEFQCKMCCKLLGSRAALQRHMKEVHHKDVLGAAACDRCGKTFQNKSNLKIHMLTHSGVKPFKCKEKGCKAAFTTKQCLQFHYKKVHGLSDEMMPKIERSIAYTLDAYSGGGSVEEFGSDEVPMFNSNQDKECNDSLDDDCSDHDAVISSCILEDHKNTEPSSNDKREAEIVESPTTISKMNLDAHRGVESTTGEIRKVDKKWTSELDIESSLAAEIAGDDQSNGHEGAPSSYRVSTAINSDEKPEVTSQKRQESYDASLLVEAALDAAERDIGVVSISRLEDNEQQENTDMYSNEVGFKSVDYQVEATDGNLESYMHDELVLSCHPINPNFRQALPSSSQYRSTAGYISTPNRLHSIEQQYLEQDILTSPRYDEINQLHNPFQMQSQPAAHRSTIDPVSSSDDSDSAVQNLSLPVKDKSIQQQQMAKYNYTSSVNRAKFEPLIVQSAPAEQGLDMSARGFHQTSDFQMQNSNHLHHYHSHHHHHHHPYKVDESERQGVDLSTSGPCVPPPSYSTIYPSYSHIDVPRVVNLESTSRSHQLHTAVSRIISSSPLPAENMPTLLSSDAQVWLHPSLTSPIPPTFNAATYSIGTAHHTSRSGHHHYY